MIATIPSTIEGKNQVHPKPPRACRRGVERLVGHDVASAAAADTVVVDQALIVDDASHWGLLGAAHARQLVLRWHVGARTFVRGLRPACRMRGDLSVAPVLPAKVFEIGCQLVARVKEPLNRALIHTFAVEWPRQEFKF